MYNETRGLVNSTFKRINMASELSQIVRKGVDKAYEEFSTRVEKLGYIRNKKTLWVRPGQNTADVITLSRSGASYGAPYNASVTININLLIRVFNDYHDFLIFNGPECDPSTGREFGFHHRFNAKSGSTFERCIDDLERYVIEQGEPWFKKYRNESLLITDNDSPISDEIKPLLSEALKGNVNSENISQSEKLLGIKKKKTTLNKPSQPTPKSDAAEL